ncbi:electron transporter, partial [Escherichia coli]
MNAFIMADAAKCIGCRTCEVACVVAHQQNQD